MLYFDDMLILARSKEEAKSHLAAALELFIAPGFVINTKKSVFNPVQKLEFFGFWLDSVAMTISLPETKLHTIRKSARSMMEKNRVSVRELARLLGMMVAAHPAILPAPLHFRNLERGKVMALHQGGCYEELVQLYPPMTQELSWWVTKSSSHNGRLLQIVTWEVTKVSDASMTGWGAFCQGNATGGPWMPQERANHINYLKLKAAFLGLKSFVREARGTSVLLRLDNITAIHDG